MSKKPHLPKCVGCGTKKVDTNDTWARSYEDGRKRGSWGKKGYHCRRCQRENWKRWLTRQDRCSLYLTKRLHIKDDPVVQLIAINRSVHEAERLFIQQFHDKMQRRKGRPLTLSEKSQRPAYQWLVSDFAHTFGFQAYVKIGDHNMCGRDGRRDAWFRAFDGSYWYGTSYGWGDVLNCRKTKQEIVTPNPGWFHVLHPPQYPAAAVLGTA